MIISEFNEISLDNFSVKVCYFRLYSIYLCNVIYHFKGIVIIISIILIGLKAPPLIETFIRICE